VYGSDDPLRQWLEAKEQPYVLAVRRNGRAGIEWRGQLWTLSISEVMALVEPTAWQRLSAGEGAKGPRMYDWALLELAESTHEEWPRQLLFRRSLQDESEIVAYRTFAPANTPLAVFAQVAGTRWAIEDSIESAKGEVGLDQYEVRRWVSWYRHITLALLAHAYLTVTRAQTTEPGQKKGRASRDRRHADRSSGTPTAYRARGASVAGPFTLERFALPSAYPRLVAMAASPSSAGQVFSLPFAPGPSQLLSAAVVLVLPTYGGIDRRDYCLMMRHWGFPYGVGGNRAHHQSASRRPVFPT